MKGTKLWQGTGSPLIGGRSRQIPPFWRPWLLGGLASAAVGNALSWELYRVQPAEFFLASSALGSSLGVWWARKMGWRNAWIVGFGFALVFDLMLFGALSQWVPAALIKIVKGA